MYRYSHSQCLSTYSVQVGERYESIVVELSIFRRLEDLVAQFGLYVGMISEGLEGRGERVRRCVHGGEDEGAKFASQLVSSERSH